MKASIHKLAVASMAAIASMHAMAENYPNKPVKLIVPYAAGGGTDIVARMLAQKLGERMGQPFVVENKAGAATQAGTMAVVKAAPDGYTLLMGTANLATNVPLFKKLPYDASSDLAPITLVTKVPIYLFVSSASPLRSANEVIENSKSTPSGFSYASAGIGSVPHLAGELFKIQTKTNMTHIPYKGSSEAVVSVVGGQTAFAFDNLPPFAAQLKAGKVKPLAIAISQRSKLTPDVPTLQELGIQVEAYSWWGVLAPAGTPEGIVEKLNKNIVAIIKEQDVQSRFTQLGIEGVGSTPTEFGAHIKAETTKWADVVKATGIEAE